MLKLLSDELWNGCRMFLVAALSNRVLKLKKLRDVMYALKCYIGFMYIHKAYIHWGTRCMVQIVSTNEPKSAQRNKQGT